jgi:hypothetical protein
MGASLAEGGERVKEDEVHREWSQFSGQRQERILGTRSSGLEAEGLPHDVPEVMPRVQDRRTPAPHILPTEETDPVQRSRPLRLGGERRHEPAESKGDEEPEGAAPHGRVLRHLSRASVGGRGGRVNRHIRDSVLAVTTRSACVRTDVKDVLTRAGQCTMTATTSVPG